MGQRLPAGEDGGAQMIPKPAPKLNKLGHALMLAYAEQLLNRRLPLDRVADMAAEKRIELLGVPAFRRFGGCKR